MLTLKIGETYPDTQGLEIPVVMRSPLFSDGKGSYIFNFKLPATDELKAECGHFHRPGRYGSSTVKKPMQLSFGPLKFAGTATITMANQLYYEVSCPIDNGELAQIFKTKKLNEIDLGGTRSLEGGNYMVNASTTQAIEYDEVILDPDDVIIFPLEFDDIELNPDDILNTEGDTITITDTGKIVIAFKFDLTLTRGIVEVRILKDDVSIFTQQLNQGLNYVAAELDVTDGDILELAISVRREETTLFTKGIFSLSAGSSMQIFEQGILNNNNGTDLYPVEDYACFPIENSKIFDKLEDDTYQIDHVSIKDTYNKYFPVLNYYAENKFPIMMVGSSESESFVAFNIFIPFPYLAYVIKSVFSEFGLTVNNNMFEDVDLKQLVIFNLFAENSFVTSELIKPNSGFDLSDHVPDVLISEYWINLCRLLGIGFSYKSDTGTLTLRYLKDIAHDDAVADFPGIITAQPELTADAFNGYRLEQVKPSQDEYVSTYFKSLDGLNIKGTVTIINLLPAPEDSEINDCYYVSTRKEWWIFNYDTELSILNWIFFSKDFQHVLEDTDEEISQSTFEVKSEISAVMMNDWDMLDHNLCAATGREWLIPVTMQAGNFDGLPDYFKAEFSKGLLFYHGLRNDSDENLYPLASNDVFDFEGNQVAFEASGDTEAYTHSLSLKWEGEFGLYEKRYKAWIDMLLRSRGFWQITASMSPLQIAALDMLHWYAAPGYRFLVKEVRFKIFHDHISTAEMDIFIK